MALSESERLNNKEKQVLKVLADKIVEKKMETPAILFLESYKPMSFIASQFFLAFLPIIKFVFSVKSVNLNLLQKALEKRESVEFLITAIEKKITK